MNSLARLLLAFLLATALPVHANQPPPKIQVFFSPRGGCTDAIITALDRATNSVLVQAYSFTSAPIAKALVNAHKRGVKVFVILDKSQRTQKYSSAEFLKNYNVPNHNFAPHILTRLRLLLLLGLERIQWVMFETLNEKPNGDENNHRESRRDSQLNCISLPTAHMHAFIPRFIPFHKRRSSRPQYMARAATLAHRKSLSFAT